MKNLRDDDSKKKRVVLNNVEIKELSKLEQVNSELSLMARMFYTIIKTDLEAFKKLFHLTIQVKQSIIEAIFDPRN